METKRKLSVEKAGNAFNGSNNCSQSILLAWADKFDLSDELCLRLASGFGGGIAMTGNVCGALTGGIMVLGLNGTGEGESKIETYEKVKQFMTLFEEKYGSLNCAQLVEPRQNPDDKRFCDKFVSGAASIIEELIED